jgi:hypothetical protein
MEKNSNDMMQISFIFVRYLCPNFSDAYVFLWWLKDFVLSIFIPHPDAGH